MIFILGNKRSNNKKNNKKKRKNIEMFFISLQGPWSNTSIDSDGERLHERVRYDILYLNY